MLTWTKQISRKNKKISYENSSASHVTLPSPSSSRPQITPKQYKSKHFTNKAPFFKAFCYFLAFVLVYFAFFTPQYVIDSITGNEDHTQNTPSVNASIDVTDTSSYSPQDSQSHHPQEFPYKFSSVQENVFQKVLSDDISDLKFEKISAQSNQLSQNFPNTQDQQIPSDVSHTQQSSPTINNNLNQTSTESIVEPPASQPTSSQSAKIHDIRNQALTDFTDEKHASQSALSRSESHSPLQINPKFIQIDAPNKYKNYLWQLPTSPFDHAQHCIEYNLMTKSRDFLCILVPFCLQSDGPPVIIEGKRSCSGTNSTVSSLKQRCDHSQKESLKNINFNFPDTKSKDWLQEKSNEDKILWVKGNTVIQKLDRSNGNIAHFAGRILFLHHVLSNPKTFGMDHADNVLVITEADVWKRFQKPENYFSWHDTVLRAISSKRQLVLGTMSDFLNLTKRHPESQRTTFVVKTEQDWNENYKNYDALCFERVIAPTFLKGRFFIGDEEYPSASKSYKSPVLNAPPITLDSLRFRHHILNHIYGPNSKLLQMHRKIAFIDRGSRAGNRRAIEPVAKQNLLTLLESFWRPYNFQLEIVIFDDADFTLQLKSVQTAAVAVAVHGANLVNTIFMPPLSVLLEIFPYRFFHNMYINGGNAGLKYFCYSISSGVEYPGLSNYASPEDCMKNEPQCKTHYRDAQVVFKKDDLKAVSDIMTDISTYLNNIDAELQ